MYVIKAELIEHEELAWVRVVEITLGETAYIVKFLWSEEFGYDLLDAPTQIHDYFIQLGLDPWEFCGRLDELTSEQVTL